MTSTVLVVDDADDLRDLAGIHIRAGGYEVAYARNGIEAIEYLKTHELPALILLDIHMPLMTGWEFLDNELVINRFSGIPVIVYSSDPTCQDIKFRRSSVIAVLEKVASRDAILAAINKATAKYMN